jgi:hypothetical protein
LEENYCVFEQRYHRRHPTTVSPTQRWVLGNQMMPRYACQSGVTRRGKRRTCQWCSHRQNCAKL